jgi:pimeloyl-ACP methyl ester carboxylesterase
MPKVKVNGAELFYQLTGSGDHLMHVPGAVVAHDGYAAVTPEMAKHFTVLDFDPRGYGLSDRPKQRYTFDVWADDMVGLLDALRIERTHVHGGSMGSSLAVHYAAKYPERVNGLILSGVTAKSDFMSKLQFEIWKDLARAYGTGSVELAYALASESFSRAFMDGPQGGMPTVEGLAQAAGRNVDVDVLSDACDALIDIDVTSELAKITAPTLVIVGDGDILTPAVQGPSGAGGRYVYDHLVNAAVREFVVIKNAGHANLMDNPRDSNRVAVGFLQRVAGRSVGSAVKA